MRRVLDTTGLRFRNALTLDVHRYLRAWYARLDIDVAGAQAAAKALPAQRRDQHETCIAMLADSCVRDFTFCPYGRIHTVVTRLHRKLRAFLHVDDEPLFNIDIANSQPLMLALLLTQYRRAGDRFFNMYTFGADAETLYLRLSPAENDPSARSGWFG